MNEKDVFNTNSTDLSKNKKRAALKTVASLISTSKVSKKQTRHFKLTHKSSRVGDVGADLAVNLDEPLHADLLHLISSQSVLEAVPQEDDEGQALPQLVGTGGRTRSLRGRGKDYVSCLSKNVYHSN